MAYLLVPPNGDLNYEFDWSDSLGESTISSSNWSIVPSGPTIDTTSHTDTNTVCYVSGFGLAQVYRLINRVTTNSNVTDERSITLRCAPA